MDTMLESRKKGRMKNEGGQGWKGFRTDGGPSDGYSILFVPWTSEVIQCKDLRVTSIAVANEKWQKFDGVCQEFYEKQ